MKRDFLWIIAIIIFILTFSLAIYPTRYYISTSGEAKVLTRVDRFTGHSEVLFNGKWSKIADNFEGK